MTAQSKETPLEQLLVLWGKTEDDRQHTVKALDAAYLAIARIGIKLGVPAPTVDGNRDSTVAWQQWMEAIIVALPSNNDNQQNK